MHEKDIELARVLLAKLGDLEGREQELGEALQRAQGELEAMRQTRDERAQYLEVLTRAAQLLNREDLREGLPETDSLEQGAADLAQRLAELRGEVEQYRGLVADLGQRAPRLLAAARGEENAEEPEPQEAEPEAVVEVPAGAAPPGAEAGAEVDAVATLQAESVAAPEQGVDAPAEAGAADEQEMAEAAAPAGAALPVDAAAQVESNDAPALTQADAVDAADSGEGEAAAPARDLAAPEGSEASLRRFNLANLKRREAFTHGRGAAYIVDATSVLERVPNYDHYVRRIEPEATREELIRDTDALGRELSGTFHLIFSSWFQCAVPHGGNVTVEFGSGPGEGTKEASDCRLRELVFEMTAKLRPVCVVTGDGSLADSVRGQGIHIIPLGEFFRA